MSYVRDLTINQMIAVVVLVLVVLVGAMVAYSVANREPDPYAPTPTPTMPSFVPTGQFQFGNSNTVVITPTP